MMGTKVSPIYIQLFILIKSKMKTLKKHTIEAICLLVFFIALKANAQTTYFSGSWQIDKTRTNFGGAPEFVLPKALRVGQTKVGLTIDRTMINGQQEEKHYIQQVTFDGKSNQTITPSGNTETDSLSTSTNKTSPVIGISAKLPDGSLILQATESWSTADDGKTLIIDRYVEQQGGMKYDIKGYYNKQ
jgi:hypothetical protein